MISAVIRPVGVPPSRPFPPRRALEAKFYAGEEGVSMRTELRLQVITEATRAGFAPSALVGKPPNASGARVAPSPLEIKVRAALDRVRLSSRFSHPRAEFPVSEEQRTRNGPQYPVPARDTVTIRSETVDDRLQAKADYTGPVGIWSMLVRLGHSVTRSPATSAVNRA